MNKKAIVVGFIIVLLCNLASQFHFTSLTIANPMGYTILPVTTINKDGTVTPETEAICRNGTSFTLTHDLNNTPIVIECSNIVFDGAGHCITITEGDNVGITLKDATSVTVKNLTVHTRNIYSIGQYHSSHCLFSNISTDLIRLQGDFNKITESNTSVEIFIGSNNVISCNTISNLYIFTPSNSFYKNNFLLIDCPSIIYENAGIVAQ